MKYTFVHKRINVEYEITDNDLVVRQGVLTPEIKVDLVKNAPVIKRAFPFTYQILVVAALFGACCLFAYQMVYFMMVHHRTEYLFLVFIAVFFLIAVYSSRTILTFKKCIKLSFNKEEFVYIFAKKRSGEYLAFENELLSLIEKGKSRKASPP